MEDMKDLKDALTAVEEELNLAKKVYLAYPFIFWAMVLPAMYLITVILQGYGLHNDWLSPIISVIAIIWFVAENGGIFRKVEAIENVLGRKKEKNRAYTLAQISSWIISLIVATFVYSDETRWLLLFIGLGLILMALVNIAFLRSVEWDIILAGSISLCALYLVESIIMDPLTFAILVIVLSFSLVAYLRIRSAMRE